MIESIDKTRWWQRIWAAFIFFTRLPFWRIYQPPQACYRTVVEHWPLVGWLTGGIMALILWFGPAIMPYSIAVLAAIICRVLITGALHEDGLADFFDGFGGGGNDRERILAIMKDSSSTCPHSTRLWPFWPVMLIANSWPDKSFCSCPTHAPKKRQRIVPSIAR